ncbi:hypothetical protein Ocin01_07559 [Orchesella cincta]|uniref:Uncharacterized protein n=1 Tax=Orchesella cincta TaxID=48709 RepID=A0A1D2N247_ORCCI|nr:hypothetical protein Ocin01_07559 [Orchesella cincta]
MYKLVNQYEFPDYEIPEMQQGPRRRRYAFPIDVQDFRVQCPVGQKLHSSGVRCVPDNDGGDDY